MPPSSDSISSTSLPFGIDNHIHASLRRSRSLPHSAHHEYQLDVHKHGPQTYPACIANAHACDTVHGHSNPQIPPSSIHNIPKSHKIVLRQHRILFWVLIGVFIISIIALTAAIVLGAVESHQQGSNDAKCAAIIVALFGFSGMVGSAAVIWLILTGRRARARLEKRWADEERVKKERGMRERLRESQIRASIKDREQSLSRSRSRGRDRDRITRPAAAKKPSFRAMTPAPKQSSRKSDQSSSSSSERRDSLWPRPLNISKDVLDDFNHAVNEKNKEMNCEHHGNDDHDKDQDEDHDAPDGERKPPFMPKSRDSVSTQFYDLDPFIREDDNQKAETASQPNTAVIYKEGSSRIYARADQSKSLPLLPDSAHSSLSPLETSPTYIDSSHMDPYTIFPYKTPQIDSSNHSPTTTTALPPFSPSSSPSSSFESPPPRIPRLQHGGLGSVQSDECFRAMLDHHDDDGLCSGDDDDKERQRRRREEIEKRVEAWASTASLDAPGRRKERGRKVREAVESGLQRVAARKKMGM